MKLKYLLPLLFFIPSLAFAALPINSVWEVRTAGSDQNGGGFSAGNGGWDVAGASDLAVDAVNKFKVTSASHSFVSGDVNKTLRITAGTGFLLGYYNINSVSGGAAILDHSPALTSSTGGTYYLYSAIDRSQQNSAQVNIDNSTITTSITGTTVTFTGGYTATAADVGNFVQFLTGTNVTAGFYEITGFTSSTWTLDRTPLTSGTTTNATAKMGGALATLTQLASAIPSSSTHKAFIKADGTYTTTATITFPVGNNNPHLFIIGYTSTRGDNGQATLQLSTNSSFYGITPGGNTVIQNITVDANNLSGSGCFNLASSTTLYNIKCKNYKNIGINSSSALSAIIQSEVTAGASGATAAINTTSGGYIGFNYVHDGIGSGIVTSATTVVLRNLVSNMSGATSDGITNAGQGIVLYNTVYNSGRHGINYTGGNWYTTAMFGNVLISNGGYGASGPGNTVPSNPLWDGNAYYNNTSGNRTNFDDTVNNPVNSAYPYINQFETTLTGSPFNNTGTGDFGLNSTAGAGASCRNAAPPVSYPGASVTNKPDMGAIQHNDPGPVVVNPNFAY